ncbi:MAG: hypothetical protein MJY56_03260 [Bacteroidales bacterium]|nr:hypothetical protein [Bacteroidales bacterium]
MKTFKHIAYFVLAAATLGFAACQEIDDYVKGELPDGAQVYFSKDNATSINLSVLEDNFTIKVCRATTDEALDVNIVTTMADGQDAAEKADTLVFPTSVSFAAGEASADFVVAYDADLMGFDNAYSFTLSIADDIATPYGLSSMTFKVVIPAPWKSLGTGKYCDNYYFGDYTDVEIQQNEVFPTQFRIVKPYYIAWTMMEEWGESAYMDATAKYGDEYLYFRILDPSQTGDREDLVYFEECLTSFYNTNYSAMIYIDHPSEFSSMADPSNWEHSYVLYYQENGLPGEIQLAPMYYMYGVGGFNYSQKDGMISIIFPGVVLLDLSVELEKTGSFIDNEGNESAVAEITLGEDVAEARLVLVPGDVEADDDAYYGALDLLLSEDEADYISVPESGSYKAPFPEDAEGGVYSLVVVSFDSEGEPQEMDYEVFEWYPAGSSNPWVSAGTATFIYTTMFADPDGPYYDEGLTIEYNEEESKYRLLHALYDVTFEFSVNDKNEVDFDTQYAGYTDSAGVGAYIANVGGSFFDPEAGVFALNTQYLAIRDGEVIGAYSPAATEYIVFDDKLDGFEDWLESQGGEDPEPENVAAGLSIADWEVDTAASIGIDDWTVDMASKGHVNRNSSRIFSARRRSFDATIE